MFSGFSMIPVTLFAEFAKREVRLVWATLS